jgi:hypothetical protein
VALVAALLALLDLHFNGASQLIEPWLTPLLADREAPTSDISSDVERVRGQLAALVPRLRAHLRIVADESRDVEQLQKDFLEQQDALRSGQTRLLALRAELANGPRHLTVAGRPATADEVREALHTGFEAHLRSHSTLELKKQILATRRQQLEKARGEMTRLIAAKRTLELELEQINANLELRSVQRSSFDFAKETDDIERSKRLLDETRRRLQTSEMDMDDIPAIVEDPIEDAIDRFFGNAANGASSATQTDQPPLGGRQKK